MNRGLIGVEIPPPETGVNTSPCEACGGRLSSYQREATYCTCGSATTRGILVALKEIATELRLIREVAERSEGEVSGTLRSIGMSLDGAR